MKDMAKDTKMDTMKDIVWGDYLMITKTATIATAAVFYLIIKSFIP